MAKFNYAEDMVEELAIEGEVRAIKEQIEGVLKANFEAPALFVDFCVGRCQHYGPATAEEVLRFASTYPVNIHDVLLVASGKMVVKSVVPIQHLPTRLVYLGIVPNQENSLELYFDRGWQFELRVHDDTPNLTASSELSMRIVGIPTAFMQS